MKRLSMLLAVLAIAASTFALPEKIYIAGNFNSWSLPPRTTDLFTLEPTGTPGWYAGTFEIPVLKYSATNGKMIFYLAIVSPDDRGNLSTKLYCTKNNEKLNYLYGDYDSKINLYARDNGGENNIEVTNWKGGKISFYCTYDEQRDVMQLSIVTPGQPKSIPAPENVWLLGDFNNWAVPSSTSDNGAIKLEYNGRNNTEVLYHVADAGIPSGMARFVFYYKEPLDGIYRFATVPASHRVFGLFKGYYRDKYADWDDMYMREDNDSEKEIYYNIEDAKANAVFIENYTGPSLDVSFVRSLLYKNSIGTKYLWYDAPLNTIGKFNLYIENTVTGKKEIVAPKTNGEDEIYWSYDFAGKLNIWLTDETEVPVTRRWGSYSEMGPWLFHTYGNGDCYNYCVRDGKPITIDIGHAGGRMALTLRKAWHTMSGCLYEDHFDASDMDEVYVTGYINDWAEPIEANKSLFPVLTKVVPGVFEGVVFCPEVAAGNEASAQFRFAYALKGHDAGGYIGPSSTDELPRKVVFENQECKLLGLIDSNEYWLLPDWLTDGYVRMRVSLGGEYADIKLTNLSTNSVTAIDSDDDSAPAVYYNLQGQRIDNADTLRPGIYILRQGRKARKITVK